MPEIHEGGCLCRAVRYQVVGDPRLSGICHCTLCKRITGSAFGFVAYFDEAAVQITRGVLNTYQFCSDESGRWIKLEFCTTCGTTVTWTAEWSPGTRAIAVGTLDEPNWTKPTIHIWTRSALDWMVFPTDVELVVTTPPE
jgi:hypothetical protein